jgi:calcium/calmodulin-dependent protein kinase (CaM kinase) II
MSDEVTAVRAALEALLNSIQRADIPTYRTLVSESLTCFEPATHGNRVDGVEFHIFQTEAQEIARKYHIELVHPVVRVYGDAAYASYTLLVSRDDEDGVTTTTMNETRVFTKEQGNWKMVHFHRSSPTPEPPRHD